MTEAAKTFREQLALRDSAEDVELLLVEANNDKTYDGVDWGAEVAVDEVRFPLGHVDFIDLTSVQIDEKISKLAEAGKIVTKFSITGYSLGGLYARYVIA